MAKTTTDPEEEYFAKQDKVKKEQLREKVTAKEAENRKKAHWMKCPKCGADLASEVHRGVEVDRCGECGGVFLDAGELETLAGAPKSGGFFKSLLGK